jgi:hypothetical protein
MRWFGPAVSLWCRSIPVTRAGQQRTAATVLGIGAVVMVAGTFAPWLESGRVSRNSYRTAGLLQRLLDVSGVAGTALNALPLLALFCAAGSVIFMLGRRRTAALVLSILALAVGALSIAALVAPAAGEIRARGEGPAITLIGCGLTILAGIALVVRMGADKN